MRVLCSRLSSQIRNSFFTEKIPGAAAVSDRRHRNFRRGNAAAFIYQRTGSLELILKIPYEYNHIFPFLASVGLFCLFLDSDIRGKIGSVAVKIAPYTLGVYLLHENLGVRYAWQKWLGSDRIDGAVSLLLWTVIAVIVVFVLGILVDVIRKNICGGLHKIFLHIRPYRVLTEKIQAVDNMFKREVS